MSRGMPSMIALLGLLAAAGYKNRDKIAAALGGARQQPGVDPASDASAGASGGTFGNLGGLVGGAGIGSVLSNGLRDLIDRFSAAGQGEVADSWVSRGPNQPLAPGQLEQAIGPDVLGALAQQTGLTREELLARLTRELPEAVDTFTPEGRLPSEDEASRLV